MGERSLHTREVAGSKPAAPIRRNAANGDFRFERWRFPGAHPLVAWPQCPLVPNDPTEKGRSSGADVELMNAQFVSLREGKVVEMELYGSRADGLKAAGLAE